MHHSVAKLRPKMSKLQPEFRKALPVLGWRGAALGMAVGLLLWQAVVSVPRRLAPGDRSGGPPGSPASTETAQGVHQLAGEPMRQADIARLNLVAAEGLPGAEGFDAARCLATLDEWAARAKAETERHLYRFRQNPGEYEHSEGYFRMLMLAVVVCEDFGVRYNPGRISTPPAEQPGRDAFHSAPNLRTGGRGIGDGARTFAPTGGEGGRRPGEGAFHTDDGFFADSRDIFLHGLLGERRTGTCSSMPVLYVALARRLGYPVSLVTTKGHLFARWEGRGERFNVECTGHGMNRYDDAHYRQWPFVLSDQEIQENAYLKSLTPAGEAAVFLSLRAECLREAGRLEESRQCYVGAARFAPEVRLYAILAGQAPGALAGSILLPTPELTRPAAARADAPIPGFGVSPVALPEDPNPLKRIQQ